MNQCPRILEETRVAYGWLTFCHGWGQLSNRILQASIHLCTHRQDVRADSNTGHTRPRTQTRVWQHPLNHTGWNNQPTRCHCSRLKINYCAAGRHPKQSTHRSGPRLYTQVHVLLAHRPVRDLCAQLKFLNRCHGQAATPHRLIFNEKTRRREPTTIAGCVSWD